MQSKCWFMHAFITSRLAVTHCCLELLTSNSSVSSLFRMPPLTGARRSDHISCPAVAPLATSSAAQCYKIENCNVGAQVFEWSCTTIHNTSYYDEYAAFRRRSGTRSADRQMLEVARCNTTFGDPRRSFAAAAPQVWNSLPESVRDFTLCEDTLLSVWSHT